MSIFSRRSEARRSRDRPSGGVLTPLYNAISASKARHDLQGSEAIYAAVTRIASTMACMPMHLYREHMILREDPRERCVAFAPNGNMTPYSFKLAMEACRNTYGRAYALAVPKDDGVTLDHLDVLDPGRVEVLKNLDNGEVWYGLTLDDGLQTILHASYVLALHHMSTDGITSISPIDVLAGTLTYDSKVREVSVSQLDGVKDSIVLTFPTGLSKEKRDEHTASFLDAYRRSRGHLIVLDSGITADRISGSVVDAKVLEVDSITKRKVATVYNLPPRMLGDTQASGYSTSEQDTAEFLKLTILPIVRQWEEIFNRRLLTYDEMRQGYGFRFDMDALKRGDVAAMADKHSKLIRAGSMTPNEARRENGLPPLPYGDELMVARDMVPIRLIDTPE